MRQMLLSDEKFQVDKKFQINKNFQANEEFKLMKSFKSMKNSKSIKIFELMRSSKWMRSSNQVGLFEKIKILTPFEPLWGVIPQAHFATQLLIHGSVKEHYDSLLAQANHGTALA
jgi:hypothetical protein